MRTLRLDGEITNLKLRERNVTLDLSLPIRLNSHQVGRVRELDLTAGTVQPKIG